MNSPHDTPRGRGTGLGPANRFEPVHVEPEAEPAPPDDDFPEPSNRTTFVPDESRSIVSENDSPDVPFRFSVNPYRGCEHGCVYCYARPTHEFLGMNAGLDFERRILVKERAPELLRDWLARPAYEPELVAFSGVTDCYQPIERRLELTRGCLAVAAEARQPVGVITKNALVTRDLDLLTELAAFDCASVVLSITTLDAELAGSMEPRTSRPEARLRAIRTLAEAGVRVGVNVAPVIPGLNDEEIPRILEAAADHGATSAGYVLLRLPYAVKSIFDDWLVREQPTKRERIESRIRDTRGGELSETRFGHRMRGEGAMADQIRRTFRVFRRRYGLDGDRPPPVTEHFVPPTPTSGQLRLFD